MMLLVACLKNEKYAAVAMQQIFEGIYLLKENQIIWGLEYHLKLMSTVIWKNMLIIILVLFKKLMLILM